MYSMLSTISQFISEPITQFVQGYEHSALMMAILLGLIGAFAPCQLTGNMSAITFYGNRTLQKSSNWQEIMFLLGESGCFSVLGFCAWLLDNHLKQR